MSKPRVGSRLARELMAYARAHGFTWNGKFLGSGHIRMEHPNGGIIIIASTPGRGRAGANTKRDIERTAQRGRPNR